MAFQAYLTIKGERQGLISENCSNQNSIGNKCQTDHIDQILVLSFSQGMTRALNSTLPSLEPIYICKYLDKSSPLLAVAMDTGERLECVIDFYRASSTGREKYYTVEIMGAVVSALVSNMVQRAGQDGQEMQENLGLRYRSITWTHHIAGTTGEYRSPFFKPITPLQSPSAPALQAPPALPVPQTIITPPCEHPDRMEELASYIADEMNRNIHHPSVLKMKELNSYDAVEETRKYFEQPFYVTMGHTPNFNAIELAKKAEAFALWAERVGQNRPWDHKPIFLARYNGIAWHKQGKDDYFHDIWSNIHYGYVGLAAGFSESVLLDGAGLEQIGSDVVRKLSDWKENLGPHRSADIDGLRAWDDVADRLSISIGLKLYSASSGGAVDAGKIMNEVLSISPDEWGCDAVNVHPCFKDGTEKC